MILIRYLNCKSINSLKRFKGCRPLRNNSTKSKPNEAEEKEVLNNREILMKQVFDESNEELKKQIEIRLRSGTLVYKGQLTPNVKRIKLFSLTTTFLGLVCYPFLFKKASESNKSAIAHVFVGWTFIMVIFSPLLLHFITKRYITELRFNRGTKQFNAYTLNLFNRQVLTRFKQDDVHVPLIPGLFTTFLVRKKPLFMDPAFVKDIPAYQHLLGHDKPIQQNNK